MHPGRRLHTTPRRTRFSRFSVCCQKVARSWQTSQPTKAESETAERSTPSSAGLQTLADIADIDADV